MRKRLPGALVIGASTVAAATLLILAGVTTAPGHRARAGVTVKRQAAVRTDQWTGTWAASPQRPERPEGFRDVTLRLIIHTTIGGGATRVRLSNEFGTEPVRIGDASVGVEEKGAAVRPGTLEQLTFDDGRDAVTIRPGAQVTSDGVPEKVPAGANLAVSLYLPVSTGPATEHADRRKSHQTSYISAAGDHAGDPGGGAYPRTTTQWFFLDGVDVDAPGTGAVVALGDSITDGTASTNDTNHRYPDWLADRLRAAGGPYARLSVLNAGIGGNELLRTSACCGASPSALARLNADVLDQPHVKDVIVLLGTNDIFRRHHATASQIIAGLKKLIARAHAAHVRVFGGTIIPSSLFRPSEERTRTAVNHWILTSHAFDGTVDFARAVADPRDPSRLNPAYDSGGHLHPNDAGYRAMADAVPLPALLHLQLSIFDLHSGKSTHSVSLALSGERTMTMTTTRRTLAAAISTLLAAALITLAGPAAARPAQAAAQTKAAAQTSTAAWQPWTATWGASPQKPAQDGFDDVSLRLIVHTTIGGAATRIRLSNTFGTTPLQIGAATVGVEGTGAAVKPGTLRTLTFNHGHKSATVQPGDQLASDGVPEFVPAHADLAVSLYLPAETGPPTEHADFGEAHQTSYISTAGNHAGDPGQSAYQTTTTSWFFLDGVDVVNPGTGAVVALGDSITDGTHSTDNTNHRYPDWLADRLGAAGGPYSRLSVVNAGIGGNELLQTSACCGASPSALARLTPDVLDQPNVRDVVVLLGTNDLLGAHQASASEVIAGLKELVRRVHARGLRVIGGTITPSGQFTAAEEAERETVNQWITTSHAFDGVADFASAVAAPGDPAELNPAYDSGDQLHPNDAGYEAMADAVPLPDLLPARPWTR